MKSQRSFNRTQGMHEVRLILAATAHLRGKGSRQRTALGGCAPTAISQPAIYQPPILHDAAARSSLETARRLRSARRLTLDWRCGYARCGSHPRG
jgi:hypothetical protein